MTASSSTELGFGEELARFLSSALVGYPGKGEVCQIIVTSEASNRVELFVRFEAKGASVAIGRHPHPQATVSVGRRTVDSMFERAQELDFRDPELAFAFEITGDTSLAGVLATAFQRPSTDCIQAYRSGVQRALRAPPVYCVNQLLVASADDIRRALRLSQPTVVMSGMSPFGQKSMTFRELAQQMGDATIQVPGVGEIGAREYLLRSEAETLGYTSGCSLPAELWSMFGPPLFSDLGLERPLIWAGRSEHEQVVTGLHRDPTDNVLIQVAGKKKLKLIPPTEAANVYPVKNFNSFQNCWVDAWNPDFEAHPDFAKVTPFQIELARGNALILPLGWFHTAAIREASFSVSFVVSRERGRS